MKTALLALALAFLGAGITYTALVTYMVATMDTERTIR